MTFDSFMVSNCVKLEVDTPVPRKAYFLYCYYFYVFCEQNASSEGHRGGLCCIVSQPFASILPFSIKESTNWLKLCFMELNYVNNVFDLLCQL